ncbi:hypothetical protein DL770_002361 [Monosporascus sp. CRB-9-2]|nr:hypothetical protein DL770_002361 [Monosporascus sp. CRB-9-2]
MKSRTPLAGLCAFLAATSSGMVTAICTRSGIPESSSLASKRCGSDAPPEAALRTARRLQAEIDRGDVNSNAKSSLMQKRADYLIIPTYLHVIEAKGEQGFVQEQWLHDQFVLRNITWTINDFWAEDAFNAQKEKGLTLRQGGYDELNIYFETGLMAGDKSTGVCSFPVEDPVNEGEEGTPYAILDGCHVNPGTLPGGPGQVWQPNDNKGKLATHEVGHWFGLLHTFSGTSCTGDGDFVDDTPQEQDPTNGGCPIGKDSCPDLPGLDPIHNYMDYADQDCQTEFTPGQEERMYHSFKTFRKGRSFDIHNLQPI